MTVFVLKDADARAITLLARAEGGGRVGDLVRVVRPGESALGKPYEEWAAVEPASVEIRGGREYPR